MNGGDRESLAIDVSVAHAARVFAYLLGDESGCFAADRVAAQRAAAVYPGGMDAVRASVRSNRAFLVRLVRWLATGAGVDQFLHVGSGIPNGTNVHAVAQQAVAGARVVYVDHDPVVLAHAHELLCGADAGTVAFLHHDLRDPAGILDRAGLTLDFERPVAVLLVGVLHLLATADGGCNPYRVVPELVDALPTGSYLAVAHLARDIHPAEMASVEQVLNAATAETWMFQDRPQVERFFAGLDLLEGGVVQVDRWRPGDEPGPVVAPGRWTNPWWVGVGCKP